MTEWISAGPVLSLMTAEERAEYERAQADYEARRPKADPSSWTQFGNVAVYGPKWFRAWGRNDGTWHYDGTDGGVGIEIEGSEYDMGETFSKEQAIALAEWILAQYKAP
jgi:hypothetical protein